MAVDLAQCFSSSCIFMSPPPFFPLHRWMDVSIHRCRGDACLVVFLCQQASLFSSLATCNFLVLSLSVQFPDVQGPVHLCSLAHPHSQQLRLEVAFGLLLLGVFVFVHLRFWQDFFFPEIADPQVRVCMPSVCAMCVCVCACVYVPCVYVCMCRV